MPESTVVVDEAFDAKLAALEKAGVDPIIASETIAEFVGEPPSLQIDITDPPSPVIARCRGLAVTGKTADEAIQALAPHTAGAMREVLAGRADSMDDALKVQADQLALVDAIEASK